MILELIFNCKYISQKYFVWLVALFQIDASSGYKVFHFYFLSL